MKRKKKNMMNSDNTGNNLRMMNTKIQLHKKINRLMNNLDKEDKTNTITIDQLLHVIISCYK